MKKFLPAGCIIAVILFTYCNSKPSGEAAEAKIQADSTHTAPDTDLAIIQPLFTAIDAHVSASITAITKHYLEIKNALENDESGKAADGGRAMNRAMKTFDKSFLTAEQRKLYDANEDDLKENAEHISESGGNIGHQREHFSFMSEDIYALIKGFGGGQALYHYFCPRYDNNNGAGWLSERREGKNPYYGNKLPECGEVKEKIIGITKSIK